MTVRFSDDRAVFGVRGPKLCTGPKLRIGIPVVAGDGDIFRELDGSGYRRAPGGIEFGEHPAAAMVREDEEETGLVVAAKSVLAIDSVHDSSQGDDFHGIRIIYDTELVDGALRYETDGTTDECRWCTRSEIENLTLVDLAWTGVRIWLG